MNQNESTKVPIELLRKYDRPGPRYTSYPTAPVWTDQVGIPDYQQALGNASNACNAPVAIYCHIPFCRRRCYYCGCNTVVTKQRSRIDSYVKTLTREVARVATHLNGRRKVSQLHLGGGTPTIVDCKGLEVLLTDLATHFEYLPNAEKSIEVDPRVTGEEQLEFLAQNGFNRISIGTQDFNPKVQEAVGRVQSEGMVRNILQSSRRLGFKGVNIDLIYGLPLQTVTSFRETIERTIELRPDRVAVYSFAYLPQAMAHQSKIRQVDLPETEVKYQLFATAIEKFTGAGYLQIGMDHFALPEDELSLAQQDGRLHRNFMGYTVQAAPDMVGLGMSSIGYVDNSFFQNYSKLDSYEASVNDNGLATYRGIKLTHDDLVRQFVISSLMCNFRLRCDELLERFGVKYSEYLADEHLHLGEFVKDGLLAIDADELRITPLGRTFVRNIAMTFDAYLDGKGEARGVRFSRTI
jgi:oxygen-independent coproporphyrinogen-3 oxidase